MRQTSYLVAVQLQYHLITPFRGKKYPRSKRPLAPIIICMDGDAIESVNFASRRGRSRTKRSPMDWRIALKENSPAEQKSFMWQMTTAYSRLARGALQ